MKCPKCGETIDEGSTFCQNCGATIVKKASSEAERKSGFMWKIEQSIYFKIARVFAWLILFIAVIVLAISIISVTPSITALIGGSTGVSQDEINKAIAAEKSWRQFTSEESHEKIDPDLLAKLDKEVYELISLLPSNTQDRSGVDGLRNTIKNMLHSWEKTKEKIAVIKEASSVIKKFPEAERWKAIDKFIDIKSNKENSVNAKKEKAKANLLAMSVTILSTISIITLVSMILVLLAIERNTRKAQ